jgi:probable phosphoglycerate mutase
MQTLLLARHGESQFSARGALNGDPGVACPLTDDGRAQARALGEALRGEAIDVCATTEFERVQETADVALAGRDVPRLVVPELNDPRYGDFEGGPLDVYRAWVWERGPLEAPVGGGEHRGDIAGRYARGFRQLLDRPEPTVLFVGHSLPVRYVLDAAEGLAPKAKVGLVAYATLYRLTRDELERALEVLEAWAAAPAF